MIDRLNELHSIRGSSVEFGERQPILNTSLRTQWSGNSVAGNSSQSGWHERYRGSNPLGGSFDIGCSIALTEIREISRAQCEIEQIKKVLNISIDDRNSQSYMQQVDIIMKRTNKRAGNIKEKIKVLKAENEKFKVKNSGSIEIMWRNNSLRNVVKTFQSTMMLYSKSLEDFNRATVNRCLRQHRYLNSNLTQKDIEAIEINPIRAHRELILKLDHNGVSDRTVDKIANLKEQNSQMREIDRGVQLIARLFDEMNLMVIEQGDTLDNIERNVEATRLHVKEGLCQIDKARDHAGKTRQKKFCVLVLCLGITVLIVFVWIILS